MAQEWVFNSASIYISAVPKSYQQNTPIMHFASLFHHSLFFFFSPRNQRKKNPPLCIVVSKIQDWISFISSRQKMKNRADQLSFLGGGRGRRWVFINLVRQRHIYGNNFIEDKWEKCEKRERIDIVYVQSVSSDSFEKGGVLERYLVLFFRESSILNVIAPVLVCDMRYAIYALQNARPGEWTHFAHFMNHHCAKKIFS